MCGEVNCCQTINCQHSQNGVAGTLPDAWWQMPALHTLQLSGNGLTGTLPASWPSGMQNLTVLKLKFNKLRWVPFLGDNCLPVDCPLSMNTRYLLSTLLGSRTSSH